jgi:Anti-anti-sigma regulatory factor (antagonist of anti-sigma factor)
MGIKTKLENGKLIIFPEGRIDTTNAMEIEKEMFGLAYEHENTPIEVDAEKLEYISSSGLRVLMKLLRMKKDKIIIRNVSSDVYKIFEVTGFTELFHIRKD